MEMSVFVAPLVGGVLIGIAAALTMLLNGRIAGISGIAFQAISGPIKNLWALLFLLGLILGAFAFHQLSGASIPENDLGVMPAILGGLLVGVGTRLGSGCTSGHGICGIARFSSRSIVATLVFMAAGMASVWLMRLAV